MDDDKKIAAAITAVNRYMEIEAAEKGRLALEPLDQFGGTTARMSLWGASGRQAQMQVRTLMQLRTFIK